MTVPALLGSRGKAAARAFLLLAVSLGLSACAASRTETTVRVQALAGWSLHASPTARVRAAAALDALAGAATGARPSTEGEALSGERPGVHVSGGEGRWAEAVLRFGPDPKTSVPPSGSGQGGAATTTLLARRPHGTVAWEAVELDPASTRPAVASIASVTRGDLVLLVDLGPAAFDAARRAVQAAASARAVPAAIIELEAVEEVSWPNTSLGLPQPGMVYAMMIVPGHRVILRLPGGSRVAVHTSASRALVAPTPPDPAR